MKEGVIRYVEFTVWIVVIILEFIFFDVVWLNGRGENGYVFDYFVELFDTVWGRVFGFSYFLGK